MVADNHSERARTVATAESRSRDSRAKSRKEARSGVGPGSAPALPYSAMGFAEGSHLGGQDLSSVSLPMAPTVSCMRVHVSARCCRLSPHDHPCQTHHCTPSSLFVAHAGLAKRLADRAVDAEPRNQHRGLPYGQGHDGQRLPTARRGRLRRRPLLRGTHRTRFDGQRAQRQRCS